MAVRSVIPVRSFARRALMVAVTLIAAWTLVSAQGNTLQFVSTPWTPFTNEAGQPRFALDLVEAALARFDFKAVTKIVEPAQFTALLTSGRYDGSAAAWKDAQREEVLVYSQPYLENRLVLVGRRGSDVSAKTLAALKGKRVAIVEGYSYGDDVDRSGPTFVRVANEEQSVERLLANAVDYTLIDDVVVQYIVEHYADQAGKRLQIGTTPLVTRTLHVAVRRTRPDAQSIVNRFNTQIRTMIVDRSYHKFLHVDWILADVDGDGVPEYIPRSDKAGTLEPQRAYQLFTATEPAKSKESERHFYMGGTIYSDWASVPDTFKVGNREDPARSTASLFTIHW